MSLSKIYRGSDASELKSFEFQSFGGPAPSAAPAEKKAAPVAPPPPTAAVAGHSAKEVEDAYARGLREGLEKAGQRLESATKALADALDEVSRLREKLAQNSRQDMLRLVMAVAEQVIRQQAAVDSSVVMNIIDHALQSAVRSDRYRVRINPADLAAVNEQKPLFIASVSGLKNLHIEADATISAGGCRVDSELGEVDATLETQLDSIRQALTAAMTEQ
ncbi:flagellar assembly protein FliH [Pelobacter seleniigenes]|uniref:FliH/SctL family protein n=1 Tax=Pelobacter seleniigenes TaxID=407188 RepID=UPI0004A6D177|nr:flagellar assembly protein FliH [Pelobacter seleniigenes]